MANRRRRKNLIPRLMVNETEVESFEGISNATIWYFLELYMNEGVDKPHIPNLFEDRLSFDMREAFEVPFLMEEVREAVFSMKKDKALGPDGYSMLFFR